MSADFLFELGTEELPPVALKSLLSALAAGVTDGLAKAGLEHAGLESYAAPRRLAIIIKDLAPATPVKEVTVWGPPAKIAFDGEGNPTKAAAAFASKNGLAVSELTTENDGKADKLVARQQAGGEQATLLLGDIFNDALAKLPIPKRMRWGARRTEFVRPVHWLVMVYGEAVVDAQILGLKSGRESRGHRFHHNEAVSLANASDYVEAMRSAYVLVDMTERRSLIIEQVNQQASQIGGVAVIDEDLLDEVTALVEWPVALTGKFEERFLQVPAEALISSMAEHQKYFHVVDNNGELKPNFITLANIESKDPAQVIDGNERVIRPRLSDAAFFFETDKKTPLANQRARLKSIVFQAKLGSIFDKTERIASLAAAIAAEIGADATKAKRAGELSKADLVTEMVLEFDKMQGIAGYYYALNDGEDEEVAKALTEQYLPKYAGDKLPETTTGTLIALADRLDTIVGIFGIGQKPTGSKDPFGLRRASLGALRLMVEQDINLDLKALLETAVAAHGDSIVKPEDTVAEALAYMLERFRAWYEEDAIATEVYLAVAAKGISHPLDINARVLAVDAFARMNEAAALAAANKRVSNILSKLDQQPSGAVNTELLSEDAEKRLAEAVAQKATSVTPLYQERRYADALAELASLREPVDRFFDEVMVMAEDESLRNNRLALLHQLRSLFLQVADISLLAPSKG
ncbi:glycine--tRNA ligase subunit beta [Gilvimarinus sp. SDUM040013]|uniref:Glycine--tRNA ligase beta subunit n=1 Tax=Gilvimarinus gilvus TaxID=3058038 RepID=A0ABU4RXE1_9GAMM|nr:glycine--tRNA ligase subunit beta [Gilvimarinus sp. SDUM040013]MDO3387707.1 glycine--tRNA ligase subunit beta [Gilvimarinus sp. SDUM040013]MDX6848852.1 glycine--tRNA ligase subunit beta [Gilvimarinus sp. SDUM040013]